MDWTGLDSDNDSTAIYRQMSDWLPVEVSIFEVKDHVHIDELQE